MATKTSLINALTASVRTGGKSKALEVRTLLSDLINTLFSRTVKIGTTIGTTDEQTGNVTLTIPAPEVTVEKQLQFDTNIIVPHQQGFFGKHQLLSDTLPNEIGSVAYFTQVDSGTTWTAQADIAAINAWVTASITETIHWRLKTVPVANTAAGTGLCEIIRRTKKL
jgi:hypothetical protein